MIKGLQPGLYFPSPNQPQKEALHVKKGDLKRTRILEAAQKLFFERGYDKTSIQDILDVLQMSKGGFYHHFPSKEAILEEICEERVVSRLSRLSMELYGTRLSPIEKLNLILRMVNLFDRDEPDFVALMLKICYLDRDVHMLDHMRSIVLAQLHRYMDDVIEEGVASGAFFVRHPGYIGEIVLRLANDADEQACRMLADDSENPERIIDIAEMLTACREAVETLLGAPFGSVTLVDPVRFVSDYRAAALELRRLEGK
jgi:AcrR family transcriptional regulator